MSNSQVMPIVGVESVDETRDFYVDKLGFDHLMAVVGADGQLDFCTVLRDGARLMFNRSQNPNPVPNAEFYIQVADVASYRDQLIGGGLVVTPLEDMWWGDRVMTILDNNGAKLWFYQPVGDVIPPEGLKIV